MVAELGHPTQLFFAMEFPPPPFIDTTQSKFKNLGVISFGACTKIHFIFIYLF
jgi:hypothetical protein